MSKRKRGVKYLITGLPKQGKTRATRSLKNAFVINADTEKDYPLNHPHTNIYPPKYFDVKVKGKLDKAATAKAQGNSLVWSNVDNFKADVRAKLKKYKSIHKKLPDVVVIDTITALYNIMVEHNTRTIKNVYGSLGVANTTDTAKLNTMIETLLIKNGIDVVILAHVVYEEATDTYIIPASGSKRFLQAGSWLSVVDYASFVWNDGDTRYISHKTLAHPCRSLLPDIEDVEEADTFDIEQMLNKIREYNNSHADNLEI